MRRIEGATQRFFNCRRSRIVRHRTDAVLPEAHFHAGEAARRLRADGPNELRALPPVPVWRRALAQLHNPLVYLLGVAAAVALAAWWFDGRSQSRILEPLAVGSGGVVDNVARGGRAPAFPEPRLWHCAALARSVVRVCGNGQRDTLVQRRSKAVATILEAASVSTTWTVNARQCDCHD